MFIRGCGGRKKSEKFVATEGTISVTTNITGASISIMDGSKVVTSGSAVDGKPFTTGKIPNGTYVVTVSKEGYKPYTQSVIVNGTDETVDVKLEEDKPEEVKAALKDAIRCGEKKVQVNFTNKIKDPSKDNFSIEGLTISDVKLTDDQKSAILTVSDMEEGKQYTVVTKGIVDYNGEAVTDGEAKFSAMPVEYFVDIKVVNTVDGSIVDKLKSDGKDNANVVVTLTNTFGDVIKDEEAEITFTTTAGNFANKKVTVQNGTATNLFTSEVSATDKEALVTATVTSAKNSKLLNLTKTSYIKMGPKIDTEADVQVGAKLTDVMVETCDRVVLFFNRNVNIHDYTKTASGFECDDNKLNITIKDNLKTDGSYTGSKNGDREIKVNALAEVPDTPYALYAILDEGEYLTDNSKLEVTVQDKSKSTTTEGTDSTLVSDIRTPAILKVENPNKDLTQIVVTFSEPIQNSKRVEPNDRKYSAEDESKWVIDNTILTDKKWGETKPAEATVGKFDINKGIDHRTEVTIKLGTDSKGKQIYFKAGDHSVQGNKIGDWANVTDQQNNLINTQTLDFTINANTDAPKATVTVESPEQFDVKFNCTIDDCADDKKINNLKLQKYIDGAWKDLEDGKYEIRKVSNNEHVSEFIVELTEDWTEYFKTKTSGKNYYNYDFRLRLDEKNVYNVANGLENAIMELPLDKALGGDKMKVPDETSPVIESVNQTEDKKHVEIKMSEPVQINNDIFAKDHQITPNEQQKDLALPTIEFVSSDMTKTVVGNIVDVDEHDKVLTVDPSVDMESGKWKVIVRNISDDIGNTASTITGTFVVDGTIQAPSEFKALWIVAVPSESSDKDPIAKGKNDITTNNGSNDRIYVKFNQQIKTSGGEENAGSTNNYTLDGYPLPSTSKIDSAVEGYNDVANRKNNYNDLVAIYLPAGTLDKSSKSHVMNINDTLKSYGNDKLVNGGFKLLSDENDDGIFTWGYGTCTIESITVKDIQSKLKEENSENGTYSKYDLTNASFDGTETFEIKHTATYDFTGKNVKKLDINTQETGKLKIEGVTAEEITVNAPNAEVELNGVKVKKVDEKGDNIGTIKVVDVLEGTLTLNAVEADILSMEDNSKGGSIELAGSTSIDKFTVDTTGSVTLIVDNDFNGNLPTDGIKVEKGCTINVENNSANNIKLVVDEKVKVEDINIIVSGTNPNNITAERGNEKVNVKFADSVKKVSFSEVTTKNGEDAATPATTGVIVAGPASGAGTIDVTVGTLKPVAVDVAEGDDASTIAGKIKSAIDTAIVGETFKGYSVVADGAKLTFTSKEKGSSVDAFEVEMSSNQLGVTFTNKTTTAGKGESEKATAGTASFTVNAGNVNGTVTIKVNETTLTVNVSADDTASVIAAAIAEAINDDETLKEKYTAKLGENSKVIISTKNTGKEGLAPRVKPSFE